MAYVVGRLLASEGVFRKGEVVQLIESYTEEKTKTKYHLVKSILHEKGEVSIPASKIMITKINHYPYHH